MRVNKVHREASWQIPAGTGENIEADQIVLAIGGHGCNPDSARAGTRTFAGVCLRGIDNSTGADGVVDGARVARSVLVDQSGPWRFELKPSSPTPTRGELARVGSATTVTAGTAGEPMGTFQEPDPATGEWFVRIFSWPAPHIEVPALANEDISQALTWYVPLAEGGTVVSAAIVTDGAADASTNVSVWVDGASVADLVVQSTAAPGEVVTAAASGNTIAAGGVVEVRSDGGSGTAARATLHIVVRKG